MSEEKSTEPQNNAPETESVTDENLESVSGGLSIIDLGCILRPVEEPTFCTGTGPFDPIGGTIVN
jgi:hypothetical protein